MTGRSRSVISQRRSGGAHGHPAQRPQRAAQEPPAAVGECSHHRADEPADDGGEGPEVLGRQVDDGVEQHERAERHGDGNDDADECPDCLDDPAGATVRTDSRAVGVRPVKMFQLVEFARV